MRPEVTCVVPARLGSTRFPGKLLQPIFGKPVIVHTLERAAEAACFASVICFTDAREIAAAAEAHGFRSVFTGAAANGTERIARHLDPITTGLVVNLQGDEPAFPLFGLHRLCAALQEHPEWAHTLVHADPPEAHDLANPNRVKAAIDNQGFVLDFYRTQPRFPAPHTRLQLGAYGYAVWYLRHYAARPPSPREISEAHELLRAPDLAPLRALAAPPGAPVDVPADLAEAAARLADRHSEGVAA